MFNSMFYFINPTSCYRADLTGTRQEYATFLVPIIRTVWHCRESEKENFQQLYPQLKEIEEIINHSIDKNCPQKNCAYEKFTIICH